MSRFTVVIDFERTTRMRHTYVVEAPDADIARRIAEWDVYPSSAGHRSPVGENVKSHDVCKTAGDGGMGFHTLISVEPAP